MGKIAEILDGKRTYIAGFLVALFALLKAFGVQLPFSEPTQDAILSALGVLVIVFRAFASKPGVASGKA